jgi:DNA invertase Pin-like site-specific DNA recombinase
MGVGGVDVAFDHVVAHEAVDDICALAFRRAAEFETNLRRERQLEGIALARRATPTEGR